MIGKTLYKKQIAKLSHRVNKILEKLGEGGPVCRSSYYNHRSIK